MTINNKREIRDPIHGLIFRTKTIEKLIDSYPMQRLRNIKQLALANLIYPGAVHTRFEHSIGVMNIAKKMIEHLKIDEDIDTITHSALLHDVGHGPFSHVSEDILDKYSDKQKIKGEIKEKIHETITCKIIESHPDFAKLLSEDHRKSIINLLMGNNSNSIIKGIVSGPLDADKQDYLLRDSHYCGVKYGIFDIDRLINSLTIFEDHYDKTLTIQNDGIHVLEQFVIAKYHMSTQVYRHKGRLLTDAMITRAIILGIEVDNLEWLRKLYTYDGTEDFINNYLCWDDLRLINHILYVEEKNGYAKNIFRRLKERKLFKRVFHEKLINFNSEARFKLSKIDETPSVIAELENMIAEYLTIEIGYKIDKLEVILKKFSIKSVRESSKDNESSIMVLNHQGMLSRFDDESTLFHSINDKEIEEFVEIYAPIIIDPDQRDSKLYKWHKYIFKIIDDKLTDQLKMESL